MKVIPIRRKNDEGYNDKTLMNIELRIEHNLLNAIHDDTNRCGIDRFEEIASILETGIEQIHEEVREYLELIFTRSKL